MNSKGKSAAAIREEVNAFLAALTPDEAKALRRRFNLDTTAPLDDVDQNLRAIRRQLAMLKKKKQN